MAGTSATGAGRLASKESFHCHPKSRDKHQRSHKQHHQALLNVAGSKAVVSREMAANCTLYSE